MSLETWAKNGWLRKHETSPQEIKSLFDIVDRDLKDACKKDLSSDWRFGIAYNAALKVCTILLYAKGYRPERSLAHYRTLQALPLILGKEKEGDATYLDKCRKTRNTAEYDQIGVTTVSDAEELIEFVEDLKFEARQWLKSNYKDLLGV
jgi:uncharacterized protein (UPF0332 family)